jgi:hypothetical protein
MSTRNVTTDIINVNAILWVEIIPKKEAYEWKWQTAQPLIKGFWGTKLYKLDEGWTSYNDSTVRNEKYILEEGRFEIDNVNRKVFTKPHVIVKIQSGKYPAESTKYFDTYEEAKAFAEEITARMPNITIENN